MRWYILHADWPTNFRGRVLIHASKWWKGDEVQADIGGIQRGIIEDIASAGPRLSDLMVLGGYIVGSVEVVACVTDHNSRWFFGRYGFVLRDPARFNEPILCKGALGFFDVLDSLLGARR